VLSLTLGDLEALALSEALGLMDADGLTDGEALDDLLGEADGEAD
jgi:hypothetical protein